MRAILIDPKAKTDNADKTTMETTRPFTEHMSFLNSEGITYKPRAFDVV